MENVINAKSIANHTVQKYNFKILTSSSFGEGHNQPIDENIEKKDIQNVSNETLENEVPKEVKDDFIAE